MSGSVIPGPWAVSGGAIWGTSPWNARVRIAEVTHFSPMNGIDSEGHARQIAATPELLLACQGLLECVESGVTSLGTIRLARAAIAKATRSTS